MSYLTICILSVASSAIATAQLCSSVSANLYDVSPFVCHGLFVSFSQTATWRVERHVQATLGCPSCVSHRQDGQASGEGVCGVPIVGHCYPDFYDLIDLRGAGSNFDAYEHEWRGWAKNKFQAVGLCFTMSETSGSVLRWSAHHCRDHQPGQECPECQNP